MTRIKPVLYEDSSQSNNDDKDFKQSFLSSIKFLLMLLISLLILISVVVLSVIWISTFSSSVTELSTKVRDQEFTKIVSFIETTLAEVILFIETIKSQLVTSDFDYLDPKVIESRMFQTYKVAYKYLGKVLVSVYIGYPDSSLYGMINFGTSSQYFNVTPGLNSYAYECLNFEKTDFCNRTTIPSVILPPITNDNQIVSNNPGKAIITPSKTQPQLPQYVFMDAATSVVNRGRFKPTDTWTFLCGLSLSAARVSNYLIEVTKPVSGSVAFIIEKKTDFIIATDDPEGVVATWDADGTVTRKTALTLGGHIESIGKIVYERFKSFDEISCNTKQELVTIQDFIIVPRICKGEGLDWILVFKVSQWNYIGAMIIGIICALLGSIIIVGASIIVAIMFSLKIVKPFNNLIFAFEMVSNMELENLNLIKTNFSEVKSLQIHFKSMIEKIKMYRRFIPPHLLNQLDESGRNEKETSEKYETSSTISKSRDFGHSSMMSSRANQSSRISNGKPSNMFSLYIEKRKVTFVNIYLECMNELLLSANPNECIIMLSDIFEAVGQLARTNNGQLGKFENETLSFYFNATNDQTNHQMKGIQISRTILNKLNSVKETKLAKNHIFHSNSSLLKMFKFRIAIHCQNNLGNIGTKQVMNFSILGSHQYNTEIMIEIAKRLELEIVVSEQVNENNTLFESRFVETREMIDDSCYTAPVFSDGNYSIKRRIYELGESKHVAADEWMYELELKEKNNRWSKYNKACDHYFNSEYELAINLLEEYLDDIKTNDKVAENLYRKIKGM